MNLNKLTVKAQEVVQSAIEIAQNYNNQIVEPEHILAAVVQESRKRSRKCYKENWRKF